MERVLVESVGSVVTVQGDVPAPAAGQALVRTSLAGICGSDTHAAAGHHPLLVPPYYPGHEATGVVELLGAGVTGLQVGQRVALKANVPCGECPNCHAGRSNACEKLMWVGCDPSGLYPGGMADYFVAPASLLYAVPDEVTDEQAVLVECQATPVHAARIAGNLTGARVVVIGAGTIGLFAVMAAKKAGAGRVVCSDLDAGKRARAQRHGADATVDPTSATFADDVIGELGGKADFVFDCVANEATGRQAIDVLRRAGSLMIVGVPAHPYALPMQYVQDWEMRVQGCGGYTEADFAESVARAADIPADEIVTGRFTFADAASAFKEGAENQSGKVVVGPAAG